MGPLRGWGPRGQRLIGDVPDGRWRTLTFLAALRVDQLTEPCVIDGPINGEIFLGYVQQFLVPSLRSGDIVILDNLGSHKSHAVRRSIRNVGAHLAFLPPYSRTSIRSNRCLRRSNTGCGWLRRVQLRLSTPVSQTSYQTCPRVSAQNTSQTLDTVPPKPERL